MGMSSSSLLLIDQNITSSSIMQILPGFRDFYPLDMAKRNYLFSTLRRVVLSYGFVEVDGPTLESTDLYKRKGGDELMGQLYQFMDKGGREVAIRPEMTLTVARMAARSEKHYRKPMKWFSIGSFFRHERQQRGRLREFSQLNCDLIGEASSAADAELLALVIDCLRAFGFGPHDFVVRLSNRTAWLRFCQDRGVRVDQIEEFLQEVDRMERSPMGEIAKKFAKFGVSLQAVRDFVESKDSTYFSEVLDELSARGLSEYVEVDLGIVRGLLYYTGIVFEVFDQKKCLRAIAGGGRYDHLISAVSSGRVVLPAIGFGIGDVVLGELIETVPIAVEKMCVALASQPGCEVFVVIAEENRRKQALQVVQLLREDGKSVDFPLGVVRIERQFRHAQQLGAQHVVIVGREWPQVKFQRSAFHEASVCSYEKLAEHLKTDHPIASNEVSNL
jgi:histidyl-tRNA synthetase